jgi:hypothetical protein
MSIDTPVTDDDKVRKIESTLKLLESIRLPWEAQIDNIIKFINHGRRKISDKDGMKGQKTGIDVYDGTAISAKNLLVDGMCGYMMSRSLRWLAFILPGKFNFARTSGMRRWSGKRMDEYPEVKEWLADCEDVVYSALMRSNFYDVSTEFVGDCVTIGTTHLMSEEDLGASRTVYTVPHFRECYIAENRYGTIDTNFRVCKYTLEQLVDKFGMDKMKQLDMGFELRYERNRFEEKEVIHAIYPRKYTEPGRVDSKNKPIASLWVLRSPLKLLDESGYDEMPIFSWRWRKNSDEWFGRSPAWDAYVDVMTANQQGKSNLIAGHKMIEPPMVGPEDMRGKVNTGPGGWTWINSMERQMPQPLVTGIQLPFGKEQQERTDNAIKEHFHVNFFLMLYQAAFNKVDLTATQVLGMQGEQAAVLGTRVGKLESEGLNPAIDRQFAIESRAGRIPEIPQILLDVGVERIEIDYMGPLAQAQKRLSKSRSLQAGLQMIQEVVNATGAPPDKVNVDGVYDEIFESTGFPPRCIRTDDEVLEIRESRARQQVKQAELENAIQITKAMPAAGKAVEEGSPLSAMSGGMGKA